jgi:hypothetical protein
MYTLKQFLLAVALVALCAAALVRQPAHMWCEGSIESDKGTVWRAQLVSDVAGGTLARAVYPTCIAAVMK